MVYTNLNAFLIRLWSTWDLSFVNEIPINENGAVIAYVGRKFVLCIILLTF